ncbi:RtcB family protein [Ornithinimicrobium humiphilum]|uniref:3'-phosphate/5'-hydroxy nucleic acid ligase n=1 Tax=Ornithinimicrobium humiphilum TaxID=125288 RepID=A0A543KNJ0_9MICO|nr:RtcB family protein [Ornithinimicrobium humiphilum]TQM96633.1 tRNA-splicing ligase RtcB [Ornithinimicrobium humiphilum]
MGQFPITLLGTTAPVKMWLHEHDTDYSAITQLRNVAELPWVEGVRVMPDAHAGKGATVGSVIAMRDAVSPSAVGVDIGCGVAAVRTSLTADDLPDDLRSLRLAIEGAVPVGFHAHDGQVDTRRLGLGDDSGFWSRFSYLHPGVQDREGKARAQAGTLGGGNHFIELCTGQDGQVWLTLHSGSRNIGKEIAERHIAVAKKLAHNAGLPDSDLAVFLAGTPEMVAYRRDLDWAQEYAARNRAIMLQLVQRTVAGHFEARGKAVTFEPAINVHHNYVATETVDGVDLLVTRKGAIRAGNGDLGMIPGSMGTGAYIVRGLGNPESYWSASHGAGRRMSRSKAKRQFTADDLAAQTAGIECRKDSGVVEELPAAYKDLDEVMAAQADLVEVVEKLDTRLCVKG